MARSLALGALSLVLLAGCGRAPGLPEGPAATEAFRALDANGDGRLSATEAALPGFAFAALDADRDGALTFFEWNARRDDADTAYRWQIARETVRDTSESHRTGSTTRGADQP